MSTNYKFKILLVGAAAVGKTSLIERFVKSQFATDYKITVGVSILTKDVEYERGQFATLSIWDIGGQVKFSFIRTTFYKGSHGALLVFDLSRADTWEQIKNWKAEVNQFAGNIPMVLIGNKLDLLEAVGEVIDREECQRWAEEIGSIYIETSAKLGQRVEDGFVELTRRIVKGAS
jgi:Ras-related protein Rab-1A